MMEDGNMNQGYFLKVFVLLLFLVSTSAHAGSVKWYGFDDEIGEEYKNKILNSNLYVTVRLQNIYGTFGNFLNDFIKTYNCKEIDIFFEASTGNFIDEQGKHGEHGRKYLSFYFNAVALIPDHSNADYSAYLLKFHFNDMSAQIKDAIKEADLNNFDKVDENTRLVLYGGLVNKRRPKGYRQMDEVSFAKMLFPVLEQSQTLRVRESFGTKTAIVDQVNTFLDEKVFE